MIPLRSKPLDSTRLLKKHFTPYQIAWIEAEKPFHERRQRVMALAEKSVRIGWTYADAFKNVRKRLWFPGRDYLFATKDYQSALEYIQQCYRFAEIFSLTHTIVQRGEESLQVHPLDEKGRPSALTQDVRVGVIKFDNGSRIIAFSANPQAMAVYGGDVGLDEFAKHPNARLLWETAQGRVTWGYDMAVWSSHDGEDTLFNEFAQEARATLSASASASSSSSEPLIQQSTTPSIHSGSSSIQNPPSDIPNPESNIQNPASSPPSDAPPPSSSTLDSRPSLPWNLYFRVTMADAISDGLVEVINRARGTSFTRGEFFADCRSRARQEEIFEQSYMCNPLGAAANHIVEWSAIERCRSDYEIDRVHLEAGQVRERFGEFSPAEESEREKRIAEFLRDSFAGLFGGRPPSPGLAATLSRPAPPERFAAASPTGEGSRVRTSSSPGPLRLGFDVAASGQGDLAAIYIDEARGDALWLRALFTCRTEDWHFLKTVLFYFLKHLPNLQAAGDESGLGRQICWEAAEHFSYRFLKVNFASKKHDLGFAIMNQLSVAEKRFPKSESDIAADYFALRKTHNGSKWIFSEGRNTLNPASHCDIAWAGALATLAHTERRCEVVAAVLHENCWFDGKEYHPYGPGSEETKLSPEHAALWSDDPNIWMRWR